MVPHAVPSASELEAEIALTNGPTRVVQHVVTGVIAAGAFGFGAFTVVTLWYFIEAGAKSTFLLLLGAAYIAILAGVTALLARAAFKFGRSAPES